MSEKGYTEALYNQIKRCEEMKIYSCQRADTRSRFNNQKTAAETKGVHFLSKKGEIA